MLFGVTVARVSLFSKEVRKLVSKYWHKALIANSLKLVRYTIDQEVRMGFNR